ncbi:MAG: imidazoleglycerol-phosphate dehydratase HisB [Candidatus Nezhaarchaeales archaeon]
MANPRTASTRRKTFETEVLVELSLDGSGLSEARVGVGFLKHMLETLAKHAGMDLKVDVKGDLIHHTVEDVAIALGEALSKALGDKKGIKRFGYAYAPMDDALARAVLDLSGRSYAIVDLGLKGPSVEDAKAEDLEHFLTSLAHSARMNLHVKVEYGLNDHHKVEAAFKAVALALKEAVKLEARTEVPSVKGVL